METIIFDAVTLPEGPVGTLPEALEVFWVTATLALWAATLCERLRMPPAGALEAPPFPPRRGPRGRSARISSRDWSSLEVMIIEVEVKNKKKFGVWGRKVSKSSRFLLSFWRETEDEAFRSR